MSHPKADCPEYIELYNASDAPCELGDYALAAGRDGSSYKITPLPLRSIPCWQLYRHNQRSRRLSESLPECSSRGLCEASLPRLLNQSGLIGLLLGDDGLVVDLLQLRQQPPTQGNEKQGGHCP